jgi:hypothetical protein
MKKVIIISLVGMMVCSALSPAMGQTSSTQATKKQSTAAPDKKGQPTKQEAKAEKATYTCPMHPTVSSEKPGKCPKCGMNLEKTELASVSYTCPMHTDVSKSQPGKCPKCGMNLEKKEDKKAAAPAKK